MREYPTTQDEEGCTASCFSGIPSRLANLLPGRRQLTGAQRIPSAPASPTDATAGKRSDYEKGQARSSLPYVPQHAAATFTKTATPRQMRKENEIFQLMIVNWHHSDTRHGGRMETFEISRLGDIGGERMWERMTTLDKTSLLSLNRWSKSPVAFVITPLPLYTELRSRLEKDCGRSDSPP
ncbi:hypothetical protein CHU98_g8369 [Xylaria longipes]|nr:hypothetical protein CHU98_g8369 [Xylaria longipes]